MSRKKAHSFSVTNHPLRTAQQRRRVVFFLRERENLTEKEKRKDEGCFHPKEE